jgi:YfiH family protein
MPPRLRRQLQPASRAARPSAVGSAVDRGWHQRHFAGTFAGTDLLTADALASIPWLVHGFSTRTGGASNLHGARVLNLGLRDWDTSEAVSQNRRKLLGILGAETLPLVTLRQIHSDVAHLITCAAPEPVATAAHRAKPSAKPSARSSAPLLQGDALLTSQPGLLLAVQTADCVPILLADTARRAVAAIHAGWRGTLERVVAKTVGRMRLEFGTRPADIVAAIGPAIGRCCYEVGPEVAQAFLAQFRAAAEWFDGPFDRLAVGEEAPFLPWLSMVPPGHEAPPERVRLDLRGANRWQLIDSGVRPRNIAVSTLCTACRADLFFSYRREGPQSGRHMAVIGIANNARPEGVRAGTDAGAGKKSR